MRLRSVGLSCLALFLLACGADPDPTAAAGPALPQIDPPVPLNPEDAAAVTMSFQCAGGHRIDVVRDQVARIALADGRVALLEVIEGSRPTTYTDNGLVVEVMADGSADLNDEGNNRQSCTPTSKPT